MAVSTRVSDDWTALRFVPVREMATTGPAMNSTESSCVTAPIVGRNARMVDVPSCLAMLPWTYWVKSPPVWFTGLPSMDPGDVAEISGTGPSVVKLPKASLNWTRTNVESSALA